MNCHFGSSLFSLLISLSSFSLLFVQRSKQQGPQVCFGSVCFEQRGQYCWVPCPLKAFHCRVSVHNEQRSRTIDGACCRNCLVERSCGYVAGELTRALIWADVATGGNKYGRHRTWTAENMEGLGHASPSRRPGTGNNNNSILLLLVCVLSDCNI